MILRHQCYLCWMTDTVTYFDPWSENVLQLMLNICFIYYHRIIFIVLYLNILQICWWICLQRLRRYLLPYMSLWNLCCRGFMQYCILHFQCQQGRCQRCNGRTWSISRIQARIETILPCSSRFVAYPSSPSIPSIPRVPGMEGYTVDESLADIERQTTICSDTRAYKRF